MPANTKQSRPDRLLILTHTHAACSVFADRTRGSGQRVEIRTIDSLIMHIATAYQLAFASQPMWRRGRGGHPTDIVTSR